MTLGKDGATVQVVRLATFIAPIRLQLALAGSPKPMRLFTSCSTIWAAKSCRVKMAYQPCFTCLCIESFGDWKFHPSILPLFTLSVDERKTLTIHHLPEVLAEKVNRGFPICATQAFALRCDHQVEMMLNIIGKDHIALAAL